ncbi:hypothetical protein [Intestinibacter bartlettii]|uniref:hypothetical protein n=1 Tax=Intestinibacter bartlettii TaxID=261299 RepID=UPI003072C410
MIKNKKKIVLTAIFSLLVLVIFCCGCSNGKLNEKSDKASVEESSVEESSDEDYSSDEDEDYSDEEIPEDCGYDDVGGTPEEQEEYAIDNKYTIKELNERVRGYISSNLNMGSSARVSVFYDNDEYGNPSIITIKIYLADVRLTSDNKEIIMGVISDAVGENIHVMHDELLNTYYHYGYLLDSLDLQFTDTFGHIIVQSKGDSKGYSDNYYDFG